MEKNVNVLLSMVKSMPAEQQKQLVESILQMLDAPAEVTANNERCGKLVEDQLLSKPDCPHCRAKAGMGFITKRGHNRNGAQRYFCKSCNRFLVAATNTAFAHSHKSADVWSKFIELTITGNSLAACKRECDISYQTAFTWRHKILNVFATNQKTMKMTGRVEMDEMLIPVSYKGNHVKGAVGSERRLLPGMSNGLPRRSFRRGTDNRFAAHKEKACVFCMVQDESESCFASVPGVGFMTPEMLDATVKAHVERKSTFVVVDKYRVTCKYLRDGDYRFIALTSNVTDRHNGHIPQIEGEYHLQHVNAMHHHIRRFLALYCGVSSKYLNQYISLFIWLKTIQCSGLNKHKKQTSIDRAAMSDCYITRRELAAFPAVPVCA